MEAMHKLCEMLNKELDKIVQRGDINSANLPVIDQLTHSIKSIKAIMAMEDESEYSGAYSRRGYSMRRDSMGRYSRDGGSYDDGYSREGRSMRGYSWDDGRDQMLSQIERLRDAATSEAERDALRQAMKVIEGQR